MDIDLLSKMVKELILDNDRVALPGLGTFVAEIVPSTFSDKGYTINPPYRRMYFRSKPNEGDELTDFYAAQNNLDKEMAEKILKDFLAELKETLLTRKTVVFPGLGRLRATKENNIFFVANEDLDIYPEGFGLEPVSLKTHQETGEEVAAAVVGLKSMLTDSPQIQQANTERISDLNNEMVQEVAGGPVPELDDESVLTTEEVTSVEMENVVQTPEREDDVSETVERKSAKTDYRRILRRACVAVVIASVVFFALLAIVGRLCPEWIDQFLYTGTELEILNKIL